MIEATEMFFECYNEGLLIKRQYPKIKEHFASPFTFQLSFDFESGKFVTEKMIPLDSEIRIIRDSDFKSKNLVIN